MTQTAEQLVEQNVRAYRRAARRYERRHPEIFNPVEQERLRSALAGALRAIESARERTPRVLDFGCGTGNLSRILLTLDADVVGADVSPEFLRMVERRFAGSSYETLELNGVDLANVDSESFDMVAAYSVLHHVPDYLAIVREMQRVLRPGGVLYIDHEANEHFWERDGCVASFRAALQEHALSRPGAWNPARRRWQRFLVPRAYLERWRRWRDPRYPWNVEGDIHVWEWDHIDWDELRSGAEADGFEVVVYEDYLHYNADYPRELWERFAGDCSDMRLMVARK